jgi:hypothetical protein
MLQRASYLLEFQSKKGCIAHYTKRYMLGGVQAQIPLQNMPDFFSVFPQDGCEFREPQVDEIESNFREMSGKKG